MTLKNKLVSAFQKRGLRAVLHGFGTLGTTRPLCVVFEGGLNPLFPALVAQGHPRSSK